MTCRTDSNLMESALENSISYLGFARSRPSRANREVIHWNADITSVCS
jgi:hypothetical protein